jgi:KaiC/GvpD/RAD55 family RecA-like ATPase
MIYGVINALKREGLTAMLIAEVVESEAPGAASEEYIADSVIYLTREHVDGQRMRFLEVMKTRGAHHLPGRSLFFIHSSGVRVVPPYRSQFFRFEQAASTGHPELDDRLGGGIPEGAFYLFEIGSDVHQTVFEINFLRESLATGDAFAVVDAESSLPGYLVKAAARLGLEQQLEDARAAQRVIMVSPQTDLAAALEPLQGKGRPKLRVFLDLTRVLAGMQSDEFLRRLGPTLGESLRKSGAVAMATLNPDITDKQSVERIRSLADGIIRVWREGNYNYLQVLKTVNSARTPVTAFLEIAEPPFFELLEY